ncbi:uncharacterized protein LOC123510146 [Portunus trituberculatus]|uniref:uncharacterized protein LOC123510146 n=1 Tax=Portunus trituberculatus TaxID=210409 RepID=UPI001E1D0546|nr:uncharacterized protein LOC123510146 [Portunus trituberculatus]
MYVIPREGDVTSQSSQITQTHTNTLSHSVKAASGMAFTAGAVAVAVLLVRLISSSVRCDTLDMDPWTRTKIMLLKPKAATMNIIVLAGDKWESRGFNVTLQKEKCFRSDPEWHFTQVNVTKEKHGIFLLDLTVGACKIECNKTKTGTHTDLMSSNTGGLRNVTVTLFGLENYTKTPEKMENLNDQIDITSCTNINILKDDQQPFCPCAFASPNTTPRHPPLTTNPYANLSLSWALS